MDGNSEKTKQIEQRLAQAMGLYRRRLDWLTTESRRQFGVLEEKSVAHVLDVSGGSAHWSEFLSAVERLLREQVAVGTKFNIIRFVL